MSARHQSVYLRLSENFKTLHNEETGWARPSKAKTNNRARKLQGRKPTPVLANRVGEVLRKMFNLATQWGWRTDNPAAGFKKRVETTLERFLSHDEIGRLAEVLDAAEDQRAAGPAHDRHGDDGGGDHGNRDFRSLFKNRRKTPKKSPGKNKGDDIDR